MQGIKEIRRIWITFRTAKYTVRRRDQHDTQHSFLLPAFVPCRGRLPWAFAAYLAAWVKRQKRANPKIESVGQLIREGANVFLRKEYALLARFAGVAAVVIFVLLPRPVWQGGALDNLSMALSYLAGTVISALTGKLGIYVATMANTKTAEASRAGIKPAFLLGFRGGAVMGLGVVSMSLLGVAFVLLLTGDTTALLGFSFGASSLALFAKAGGGIFTKTADISADPCGQGGAWYSGGRPAQPRRDRR